MKTLPLNQGTQGEALISDKDYEWASKWHWSRNNSKTKTSTHYTDLYYVQAFNPHSKITTRLHVEVWVRNYGVIPRGMHIDHIDGNTFNCQLENLRLVTQAQNTYNKKKTSKPCSSQYKGVSWNKKQNKWFSKVQKEGKAIYSPSFTDEILAAEWYDINAMRLFGQYAQLNFPRSNYENKSATT